MNRASGGGLESSSALPISDEVPSSAIGAEAEAAAEEAGESGFGFAADPEAILGHFSGDAEEIFDDIMHSSRFPGEEECAEADAVKSIGKTNSSSSGLVVGVCVGGKGTQGSSHIWIGVVRGRLICFFV